MSKNRNKMSALPKFEPVEVTTTLVDEVVETVTAPVKIDCEVLSTTVDIPFISAPPITAGHQDEAHRIDMGTLTQDRMRKVKAMRRGYIASDTRMAGGYEVKTNRDALFCFLDQLDI